MSTTKLSSEVVILVSKCEVVIKRLLELLQLATYIVQTGFRSRYSRLLLLRHF